MPRIAVIGSLNMDVVAVSPRLPARGETIIGSTYLTVPGGKGANQAFAAARLQGDVAMLGRVGTDEFGRQMRANLHEAGCDVRAVEAVDGGSGVALIVVEESGQNAIVVVPGANAKYVAEDVVRDIDRMAAVEVVLLQLETPLETVIAAAAATKRRGAMVILDPAPAPDALPPSLLQSIDILTPNETEAAHLVDSSATQLSPDEARAIGKKLQEGGCKQVIIKLGSQGCLLMREDDTLMIPAPRVHAVDTTAAGDVFNAALAVALAEGADLSQACRFAVEAAALSVTRLGAQAGMPRRAEVSPWAKT